MRPTTALALSLLLLAVAPNEGRATSSTSALNAGGSSHGVVLSDGSVLQARTRPTIMLGVVSFLGLDGQVVSLPTSAVNLVATRAGLAPLAVRQPPGGVWDERAVAKLSTQILPIETGEGHAEGDAAAREGREPVTGEDDTPLMSVPADLAQVNAELMRVQAELAKRGHMDTQSVELRRQQRELAAKANALTESYGGAEVEPEEETHHEHDGHSH